MTALKPMGSLIPFLLLLLFPMLHLAQEDPREFYQLRIYHFENEQQTQQTEHYLQQAYIPALKRIHNKPIGVFKPKADSLKQLYLLMPISTMEELDILGKKLAGDPEFLEKGKDYLTASTDHPPFHRIETIVLRAFEDMPELQPSSLEGNRKDRVYELRSYQSATEAYFKNKLDMFNAGGEIDLFDELGFNAVFYGEVLAGRHMPNLMYLTTFQDQQSRDQHWKEFGESPKWKSMAEDSKYQDNVSHIDIHFLYPTEYSDY